MDPIIVRQADFDNNPNVFDDYATVFLIYEDIDLRMQTIHGQQSSTFCFRGGSFNHGTLDGYVNLRADSNNIFGSTLYFTSSLQLNVPYLRPEWFGAKGDYNPNTHKGTDDTAAISRAVRTAEILSIKTVKFNAVNYLVSGDGIMIYRGNIILEGSGAMLREEQMKSVATRRYKTKEGKTSIIEDEGSCIGKGEYTLYKGQGPEKEVDTYTITNTSTIYCKNEKTGNTCVTCYRGNEYEINLTDKKKDREEKDSEPSDTDPTQKVKVTYTNMQFVRSGVSDPIYIKDLQFICDVLDGNGQDRKCIGISFNGTYYGPTWPVIIERCYFKFFDKAFLIDSAYDGAESQLVGQIHTLQYPIHCLTFRDNAFWQNNWCVYAEECEYVTKNPSSVINLYEGPWSFEFIDNRCHQNDFLIRICVQKGLCLIENNNTEGTSGITNKGKESKYFVDTPSEYAIEVQLGQRAIGRIGHNHFEGNRTRLIKVVGYFGNDCRAIVTETNTDGMNSLLNKCYFENVILETDQNAVIRNCIVENKLPCEKALTLDDIKEELTVYNAQNNPKSITNRYFNTSFSRYLGNKFPENVQNTKTVRSIPQKGTAKFVNTPYGRHQMLYHYKHANNYTESTIIDTQIYDYLDNAAQYLIVEFPYYRISKSGFYNRFKIALSINGQTNKYVVNQNKTTYILSSKSMDSNRAGFYWARFQLKLDEGPKQNVHINISISTDYENENNKVSGIVYTGAVTFATSYDMSDMNMQITGEDFDVQFSGRNDEKLFIDKNDYFMTDNYRVDCLHSGYTEVNREFFLYNDGNGNIVICKPIIVGTCWSMGNITFRISSLADQSFVDSDGTENENGEYLKYHINIIQGTYSDISMVNSMSGAFDCVRPVLLGKGTGSSGEMNADIVPYLCEGSTFYSVTDGKMYVRTATGNWKEL